MGGGAWSRVWNGRVVLCLCELCVWIFCVGGRSRYLYIVLGGCLRILGTPSVQSCFTLSISASYRVFVCGRYRKSIDLFACGCRTWICLDIARFYEDWGPGGIDTATPPVCCVSYTACMMCRCEPIIYGRH